ncbi:hypothetical protein [Robertmurraya sp. P23]|uniref:hypothetical protein n=1 Tax=Robertmurraya sp. P23 TaxID=3436931 RepID=UPI003D98F147
MPNYNSSIRVLRLQRVCSAIAYNPTYIPDPHPGNDAWGRIESRNDNSTAAQAL